MANLISVGVNGLLAHQSALSTTGNNITNANTPGYSRQRVEFATLPEQRAGAGYVGQGTTVDGINRIVDQFLVNQLRVDTSSFNYADTLATQFSQLDSLLADTSTGLAPALQAFYDSLQQASQDPTSIPIRQVVLSTAATLAQRFKSLNGQLQSQEKVINEQLSAMTDQVTALANGIASLNQQISQQTSGGAQPNALLDKRDEMVREISELIGVSVVPQGNGMVNVFIGNGQPLVVGNQAATLSTRPSEGDASRNEVIFSTDSSTQEITQFLKGGRIGGLLQYRKEGLDPAFNALGQTALTLAESFNSLQMEGMDLDGEFGSSLSLLFTDINTPVQMANRAVANNGNAGNATLQVAITTASELTTADYQLAYSGGSWSIAQIPGGTPVPYTPDSEFAGFTISIPAGTPVDGDTFVIRPTRQGAGSINVAMTDPRDLALAQPVRTSSALANAGTGSLTATTVPAATLQSGALVGDLMPMTAAITGDAVAGYELEVTLANGDVLTLPGITPGSVNAVMLQDDGVGGYTLAATTTTAALAAGDHLRFELGGNFRSGDRFTLGLNQNSNGTSDNRNALAMLDRRLDRMVGTVGGSGGQTIAGSYGSLVSRVGARTAELKINQEAADTVLAQAQANRDASSGVNLDEEAANLIKFEQAYNASAQVISIARSLFDSLLGAFR